MKFYSPAARSPASRRQRGVSRGTAPLRSTQHAARGPGTAPRRRRENLLQRAAVFAQGRGAPGLPCRPPCSRAAPLPRFTDLQDPGRGMAKIPWRKPVFADRISDHVLFIIMTCSETVCYSYVGLPWIFFSSFSTLKTAIWGGEGRKQISKCFCVHTLPQRSI